jgi:flagellar protein FlbD
MIQLTRLNNTRLAVNCDLIKYVEEAPDTVITLVNGEKLLVRETTAEVIECVRQFRRSLVAAQCRSTAPTGGRKVATEDSATHSELSTEGPVCG